MTAPMTSESAVPFAAPSPALSIIIVSYNTREMTLGCLASVYRETRETRFELIVLDNASTDGSADAIAASFPAVRLIRSADNLGFAGANNAAAREARGDYLLLLNPDTVVLDAAIDRLMRFARDRPEAQLWGGRTVFADGSLNATAFARQIGLWSLGCRVFGLSVLFPRSDLFNSQFYGRQDLVAEREVDVITGCLLLIRRAFWEDLGGFDPSFVMFAEEADLCLRAVKRGARPRVTPQATIIHHGGASETIRAERLVKLLNGTVALIEKHWRWPARPAGKALLRMMIWTRHVGAGLLARLSRRREASAAVWTEVWSRRDEWREGYPLSPWPDGA